MGFTMKERDFKTQVFRTAGQWGSGLFYRLEQAKEGGLTILSVPAVAEKLPEIAGVEAPVALAADCCGLLYIRDSSTRRVYRHDPKTGVSEMISCAETEEAPFLVPDGNMLWISDSGAGGVRACSLKDMQIVISIDLIASPHAIAVNSEGDLYALDSTTRQVYRFDRSGTFLGSFGSSHLKEPCGCAIAKEDAVCVADKESGSFKIFSKDGAYRCSMGDMGEVVPVMLTYSEGSLFLLSDAGEVFQFDPDGSILGKVELPEDAGPVIWLTADRCGKLYASTGKGIYLLVSGTMFIRENGCYYAKTIDSGITGCRWHRLALQAVSPAGTTVDVFFHTSDDGTLKDLVDQTLADPNKTVQEKAASIDGVIPWTGPEKNVGDMLFRPGAGRYIWVKLSLATYDGKERPAVREMRVYYQRISYLRYLPATYQDNAVSRDFLERFLSLFESVFYDLEVDISRVTRYLDPDTTPPEFLRWLGSWINMALEEDWPEKTKREFIRQAARLYTMKGTVEGISRFIEILTGKAPVILEHARDNMPVVLGGPFSLGVDTIVGPATVRGFRLGDDSIIGHAALRDVVESIEDPFLPAAFRFTIIIDLTQEERRRYEKGLNKLITDEKPAHTTYRLRVVGGLTAGGGGYVGISTVVGGYDLLRVGASAVGSALLREEGEEGGRVEVRSAIGEETRLI